MIEHIEIASWQHQGIPPRGSFRGTVPVQPRRPWRPAPTRGGKGAPRFGTFHEGDEDDDEDENDDWELEDGDLAHDGIYYQSAE